MLSSKAYTEVYYIICHMSDEMRSEIPEKIINNIKNRMDKNYNFVIEDDDFENVKLLDDTEKILSVLYTDYLATDEEREIILNKEKIINKRKKENEYKVTVINDVFNQQENSNTYNFVSSSNLVEKKEESWYRKIINFLKNLLK